MLTKDELITEILAQPDRIADFSSEMMLSAIIQRKAINALKDAEGALLIAGFDHLGKTNEAQRDAHIRAQTNSQRDEVDAASESLKADVIELERMNNEFKGLLAVAALMAS